MIARNDYRLPSGQSDKWFLLRNKRAAASASGSASHSAERTVLFVHGATYGATDTFDYALEGQSWMDVMASQGFDTWCLDLLGYGQSDRPTAMDEPADKNPPLVDTDFAVNNVHEAVTYILAARGIDYLQLIGYSWGTAICGSYAGRYRQNVGKLVLYGPLWLEGMTPTGNTMDNLGAYRTVDAASMMARWAIGLEKHEIDEIVSENQRKHWCEQTASCDPTFARTGELRAPTGVMRDYLRCRESGSQWYDPALINSPVQIVVGEWDAETTPAQGEQLFSRLAQAATKQMTVIGQGTHSLLLEKNRHQLHSVVGDFLQS